MGLLLLTGSSLSQVASTSSASESWSLLRFNLVAVLLAAAHRTFLEQGGRSLNSDYAMWMDQQKELHHLLQGLTLDS